MFLSVSLSICKRFSRSRWGRDSVSMCKRVIGLFHVGFIVSVVFHDSVW